MNETHVNYSKGNFCITHILVYINTKTIQIKLPIYWIVYELKIQKERGNKTKIQK